MSTFWLETWGVRKSQGYDNVSHRKCPKVKSSNYNFVCCSEVSLAPGLMVDHAPPTITATYDKALVWMTKKTVLMRDLSTDSS